MDKSQKQVDTPLAKTNGVESCTPEGLKNDILKLGVKKPIFTAEPYSEAFQKALQEGGKELTFTDRENTTSANIPDTIFDIPEGYEYGDIEKALSCLQRLSADKPIPEPAPLLSMGDAVLLREGGLVFITGKAGCRKTTALTLMCADVMRPNYITNSPFTVPRPLKVMYIDPEQLPADTQRINNRIKRLIGSDDDIDVYPLVEVNIQLLPSVVEALMNRKHYDLVVIDNVMKLGKDMTMDISIAEDRIRNLRRLALKHSCGIIGTVHMNQGETQGRLRGHAGAEAVREGDLVLGFIESDIKTYSYSKVLKKRLKEPSEFCVSIDETGLPFYYQKADEQIEAMRSNVKTKGKNSNPDKYTSIIRQIATEGIEWAGLIKIITTTGAVGSQKGASNWIARMQELHLIHKRNNRYYVGAEQQVKDTQESFEL